MEVTIDRLDVEPRGAGVDEVERNNNIFRDWGGNEKFEFQVRRMSV